MVTAYVMVKSMIGEVEGIRDTLYGVDGVVDAHIVAGDVDIVVKLDVATTDEIKDLVANRIHEIEGVESTTTYIAMD